ncbi:metallophosphoesterase [Rhodohalobacter sulfatireducens]|uniref:Metallophosphoesterase n=1 Tax=Rhodohalobacter sulfatireducens TaxID=2911366 RepID=A0ABS9KGP1_9BACT|nr:metallophosphoesterase [Rhodohalobacter sulfatireducens]MCG2590011.1 metallophosphoesterase [Rhodohalobacter sulfatireducens]
MPWPLRMVLYASILLVLFLTYFGFRYFRSLSIVEVESIWMFKSFFVILVMLFVAFPAAGLMQFNLQGTFSVDDYPHFMIYLFWFGFVFSGVMLNWLILHDLLLPVFNKFSSFSTEFLKLRFAQTFLTLAAFTLLFTAAKMVWDTNRMVVERITYEIPGESSTRLQTPLNIVHITDLHADVFTTAEKMDRYIQLVNQEEPDLVFFTGDLITEGIGHVQEGADALQKIKSTYGVYAVIGDHDYWAGPDHIVEALEQRDIQVLENEHIQIDHNGTPIFIAGVTEIYSYNLERSQLQQLINSTPNDGIKIVSSHQASDRLIEFSQESGTDLLLSGHTHGGQVRIPVFFYPFTAVRSETTYVKGHWNLGNMLLNVNSGLGFTLSPIRYNAPAQVSVITVQ